MRCFLLLLLAPAWLQAADYDRSTWQHWEDFDGDCFDTRQEILLAESLVPATHDDCRVTGGVWVDLYAGGMITNPSLLDVDHVIPLHWAHQHGADGWSETLKRLFANDPENLIAVGRSANRSKGSRGPSEYLPELYRCEYVRRWRLLLGKYQLVPTLADAAAILEADSQCFDQPGISRDF